MATLVEICVESPAGAIAAGAGGAGRVELCVDRAVGGLTPDPADVAAACRGGTVPVHVLIRPRAEDFVYTDAEFRRMRGQVAEAARAGASGVVLGVLLPDGRIDRVRTAALVALARPMAVTFHKAFDATPDPFAALDVLAGMGVERVLTSGGGAAARDGLGRLADLVRRAEGRVTIMAGGSVSLDDLPGLRAAGVDELHVGSAVAPGGTTDAGRVRALVAAWRRPA